MSADFAGANVDVIGPSGNISGILFYEKEGFNPLFRAVKLANRYDLMIISTKGVSVTAARRLIDDVCGNYDLPLFVLHDFDVAGFLILATLQRDTRRFQFSSAVETMSVQVSVSGVPRAGLPSSPPLANHATSMRNSLVPLMRGLPRRLVKSPDFRAAFSLSSRT